MPQKNNRKADYERASGSGLHEGHRERMRNKLKIHGDRVFETHELMEMLLYHIVPYRDTNPAAWRLMKKFSTLDGVAAASKEEIFEVDGIGERTAEFIARVFELSSALDDEDLLFKGEKFLTTEDVGDFLVDYYQELKRREGEEKYRVVAIMLDTTMRILSITEPYNLDASSGAVKTKPFVDAAVAAHAKAVIIAHNHPYSGASPSAADKETHKMFLADLEAVGITLVEDYIVSGYDFCTLFDNKSVIHLSESDERTAPDGTVCLPTEELDPKMKRKTEYIFELLSLILKEEKARKVSSVLSRRFFMLYDLFTSELYVLKKLTGCELTAVFLKLFFALYIRRKADRFKFGRVHTEKEIAEYFMARIGYEPIEKAYVMLFDAKNRAFHCEFVAEGTVDRSNFIPRQIVEIASKNEAFGLALVHNHPSSGVEPSRADKSATVLVESAIGIAGIKFYNHYIVSHNDFCIVSLEGIKYKKDFEI